MRHAMGLAILTLAGVIAKKAMSGNLNYHLQYRLLLSIALLCCVCFLTTAKCLRPWIPLIVFVVVVMVLEASFAADTFSVIYDVPERFRVVDSQPASFLKNSSLVERCEASRPDGCPSCVGYAHFGMLAWLAWLMSLLFLAAITVLSISFEISVLGSCATTIYFLVYSDIVGVSDLDIASLMGISVLVCVMQAHNNERYTRAEFLVQRRQKYEIELRERALIQISKWNEIKFEEVCTHAVLALHLHCTHTTLVLHSHYARTTLILHSYYTHTTLILHLHYTYTTLILHLHYTRSSYSPRQ
jgi:hypothetical protein